MNQNPNQNSRPKFFSNLSGLLPWVLFAFYFFVFPKFESTITPVVRDWINSLGIWAPIGYISFGTVATVIAPIGLGPINLVLQRGFGYWPSVTYFWIFETIGMSINFWLSRRFGHQLLNLFFAGIITKDSQGNFNDPITRFSSFMLNKNFWSALAVMLGLGGELLSYLAGLSNLKFYKFLAIIALTNFINSLIFVGSNLTIGTNNTVYFGLQALSLALTFTPLMLVFHKEIFSFARLCQQFWQTEKKANRELTCKIEDLKNQKISKLDFNLWYLNYLDDYLKWSFLIYNSIDFLPDFVENLPKTLSSGIRQKLRKLAKKLDYYPRELESQILQKQWKLGKNEEYDFRFER